MYIGFHVIAGYSCQILAKFEFYLTDFQKIMKYQISPKSVQSEPSFSIWTNKQTHRHDKSNSHI
jgi:hypothetical protein